DKLPSRTEEEIVLYREAARIERQGSTGAIAIELIPAWSSLLPGWRSVETRRLGDGEDSDRVAVAVRSNTGGKTAGSPDEVEVKRNGHESKSVDGKGPRTRQRRKGICRTSGRYSALRSAGHVVAIVSADEIDLVRVREVEIILVGAACRVQVQCAAGTIRLYLKPGLLGVESGGIAVNCAYRKFRTA